MHPNVEANRRRWDELVPLHVDSTFYDVQGFIDGRDTLSALERRELGDVSGLDLVHMQCHFGMDSLSLARSGARVTGVDFSGPAVEAARRLSETVGVPARFVQSEITRAPEALGGQRFDVVFTSWGVLGWLPDIPAWARTAAALLKPGGTFYIAEIHPVAWLFDPDGIDGRTGDGTTQTYPYFGRGRDFHFDEPGSYAAPGVTLKNQREHFWIYEIGQVVTALLDAGMELEFLREHEGCCNAVLPDMTERDDGLWYLPPDRLSLPLSFSIRARTSERAQKDAVR